MAYFPMFVSLEHRPCLIVGGGRVAFRKCAGLLAFGADVTMVAESFRESAALSGGAERLHRLRRSFREEDLRAADWAVVIAATDDRRVNGTIAACCRERGIPVNVADCRQECSFFFPAWCREGEIAVGVSTSGISPGTASLLRQKLEAALPGWLAEIRKEGKERG